MDDVRDVWDMFEDRLKRIKEAIKKPEYETDNDEGTAGVGEDDPSEGNS